MDFGTIVTLIISISGFLITIATLSRKMITKDDLKEIKDTLSDLTERHTNVEKKLAVMEYKVEELQRKVNV